MSKMQADPAQPGTELLRLPEFCFRHWSCSCRSAKNRQAVKTGGAYRDRTDDPLLAKQVLSQLSYSPLWGPRGVLPRFWMQVSCVGTLGWRSHTLKEVIQPHLPIRLPCYDFTPVIDHSVASVLLAVRLPASGATNSHGVTGGVYKARERIHRDNADSRLLAIPTSRSRVADSDPD